ncbi:MAG: 4Fe-4S binding protein [Candidatus Brocadiae bacterium]|nr:4Fe-4S binding protein [Candidatus Brocadiia bacterium]
MEKIKIKIDEKRCVGCFLCENECPTKVFGKKVTQGCEISSVVNVDDCIGCLSCAYICPSGAIEFFDLHIVPNFYREIEIINKLEKFL